jgi:hypothetical protein
MSNMTLSEPDRPRSNLGRQTARVAERMGAMDYFWDPEHVVERELLGLVADLALCVQELSRRLDAAEGRMA